jgi:hypothetical protein|tara:strand:+ start:487 stop:810 length:324 start_codon:yes stop_codon:yes gene_type:complete
MSRPGATPTPLEGQTADSNATVAAHGDLRLVGFAAKEEVGAAASFEIVHGATGDAGAFVIPVTLLANETTRDLNICGGEGILVPSGLSINFISGQYAVTLLTKAESA